MTVVTGPWELCNGPFENGRILLTPIICCFLDIHVVEVVAVVFSQTAVDNRILRCRRYIVATFRTTVRRRPVAVQSAGPASKWLPEDGLHRRHTGADLAFVRRCVG